MFDFILKNFRGFKVLGMAKKVAVLPLIVGMWCGVLCNYNNSAMASDVAIIATVNGDVITSYELGQRIKLSKKLLEQSNIKIDDEGVRKNVLREMIDDKLKIAEARKFNVNATNDDIAEAKERMENYLGLGVGGYDKLVESLGLEKRLADAKVRADVVWMKFVFSVLRGYIRVTDSEVNLFVDNMRQKNHFMYDLVPLIIGDSQRYDEVKSDAMKITDCKEFEKYATKNGADGSGNMFSVKDSQLDKDMFKPITSTNVGSSIVVERKGLNEDEELRKIIFFVCAKNPYKEEFSDEQRAELRMKIYQEKLDSYANKYLDKMRKTAIIDLKQ